MNGIATRDAQQRRTLTGPEELTMTKPAVTEPLEEQRRALGAYIREHRKRANLSLRQLAERTSLSNPYLSQIERGLHEPSVRVLRLISGALNLSVETLLARAGLTSPVTDSPQGHAGDDAATENAIRADRRLNDDQKAALIAVYRSMLPAPDAQPSGPVTR
jgi:transcriptional regulator with XRE-family HTH domain